MTKQNSNTKTHQHRTSKQNTIIVLRIVSITSAFIAGWVGYDLVTYLFTPEPAIPMLTLYIIVTMLTFAIAVGALRTLFHVEKEIMETRLQLMTGLTLPSRV
jgi:membrane-associated HD superfamily phosphohydrolase